MGATPSAMFSAEQFARSPVRSRPREVGISPAVGKGLDATLLGGGSPERQLSSNLSTFLNIINNYVGMVLLSMHFTFARAGWLALPTLAVLTAFGAFTGDIIVESYKTIEASSVHGSRAPSYAQIGERCLGTFGKWLVVISSVIETFFALLCMLLIIWTNAALLMPAADQGWVVAACIALSLPTNLLRDFSILSFLSAFGLACVVLIVGVVFFNVATHVPTVHEPIRELANLSGLPMSGSIMLAGLTGHVGLPPMYAEMKTPSAFRGTLYASFAAMLAMYVAVGVCGYLLYGDSSHMLITEDAATAKHHHGVLGRVLNQMVLGAITFKLFCGVPVCVLVLVDIANDLRQEGGEEPFSQAAADRARLAIWIASVVCALAVASSLQYVTALIGINSMLISILLPLLFYVQLHRHAMGTLQLVLYAGLVVVSVLVTFVIGWVDVQEFFDSLNSLNSQQPQR